MAKPFRGTISGDIRDWEPDLGVDFRTERVGDYHEPHGTLWLHVDHEAVAEAEIRTIMSRYGLCGEGVCIGYDGGDAVSAEYKPPCRFTGGRIIKVVCDAADDAYVDVECELASAMARD
jgi:arylsulfatase